MEKKEGRNRARKWIFTIQGEYPQDVVTQFFRERGEQFAYVKYASETGETGNNHIQGYIEFHNKLSLTGVVKFFNDEKKGGDKMLKHPHVEIAWNATKAQEYVGNKDFIHEDGSRKGGIVNWVKERGTYTQDKGEARRQGRSWNDTLLEMKRLIDENCTIYDLYQLYFIQMMYCGKAMKEYAALVKDRQWEVAVERATCGNTELATTDEIRSYL